VAYGVDSAENEGENMSISAASRRGVRLSVAMLAAAGLFALVTPAVADEGFRISQTCAGCHGTNGASPGETIPVLGGQNAAYLAESLRAYKSGDRDYYVMKIIANGFDDAQIDALSAWFANQTWVASEASVDTELAENGKGVADGACASCHGAAGEATDVAPRLAGQPAAYLSLAARAYKNGARSHTAAAAALANVSDADIEAASHYYASIR
jgi:sulfide dehydrogenase cytochrome subunit